MPTTNPIQTRWKVVWAGALALLVGYLFFQGSQGSVHWALLLAIFLTLGMMAGAVGLGKFASSPLGKKVAAWWTKPIWSVVQLGFWFGYGNSQLWRYFHGQASTSDAIMGFIAVALPILIAVYLAGVYTGRDLERRGIHSTNT